MNQMMEAVVVGAVVVGAASCRDSRRAWKALPH